MAEPTDPTVMQQFDAIRQRVAATPTVESLPPQTGERLRQLTFVDSETKEPGLTGYSVSGPRTKAEFEQAAAIFAKTGKVKGFTFLEPGLQATVRDKLGAIGQAGEDFSKSAPLSAGPLGGLNPAPQVYELLKKAAPVVTGMVDTPEKVGSLVGTAAAGALAGPLALPLKALTTGAGAGIGYAAGQALGASSQGESNFDIARPAFEAALTAASTGLTGVFKYITGRTMSDNAQSGVAGKVADLVKSKYSSLTHDPALLESIGSTEAGANQLIQLGINGIRGDAETITTKYTRDLLDHTLGLIPVSDVNLLHSKAKQLVKLQGEWIDNVVGSDKIKNPIAKSINTVNQEIKDIVFKAVKGAPDEKSLQFDLLDTLNRYNEDVTKLTQGAKLFDLLNKSVGPNGFDVRKFQGHASQVYQQDPGSMLELAGQIAGRGGDISLGTDTTMRTLRTDKAASFLGVPLPNNVRTGESFVGHVPGRGTDVAGAIGGSAVIKGMNDYFSESYQSKDYRTKSGKTQ